MERVWGWSASTDDAKTVWLRMEANKPAVYYHSLRPYRASGPRRSHELIFPIRFPVEEFHITGQVAKSREADESSKRIPTDSVMWASTQLVFGLAFGGSVDGRFRWHEAIHYDELLTVRRPRCFVHGSFLVKRHPVVCSAPRQHQKNGQYS